MVYDLTQVDGIRITEYATTTPIRLAFDNDFVLVPCPDDRPGCGVAHWAKRGTVLSRDAEGNPLTYA